MALSLASRLVGVTHHRILRSPDFPLARIFLVQNCRNISKDKTANFDTENMFGQRLPGPLRFFQNRRTAHDEASGTCWLGCECVIRRRPQENGAKHGEEYAGQSFSSYSSLDSMLRNKFDMNRNAGESS